MIKRKWNKVIKAWADGYMVEYLLDDMTWKALNPSAPTPYFEMEGATWRVAPGQGWIDVDNVLTPNV